MDIMARNQYFEELRKEYLTASKKVKNRLLDEACKRTRLCRKHIIIKLACDSYLGPPRPRKKRKEYYDGALKATLVKAWGIFDYPCGQRLAPLLRIEVDRLRRLKELPCSDEVAEKLKQISPASIDIKLRHEKEVLNLKRNRHPSIHPLLYKKIPIRLIDDWDKTLPGNCQLDFVWHCGSSLFKKYISSLSLVDIYSGWWEAQGIMHKSQWETHSALEDMSNRTPFPLKEIHPDNDQLIINDIIYRWTKRKKIAFSRSRPNKKNDNAYVEQKNWTHIRKIFGYRRYDTKQELEVMNNLYTGQLRLYKNFFQPVTKLIKKERVGSKIHRRYDIPKTPYQRLIESRYINKTAKKHLTLIYQSLNPAQLKREINIELAKLHRLYEKKKKQMTARTKKIKPSTVRNYIIHPSREKYVSVR